MRTEEEVRKEAEKIRKDIANDEEEMKTAEGKYRASLSVQLERARTALQVLEWVMK